LEEQEFRDVMARLAAKLATITFHPTNSRRGDRVKAVISGIKNDA